MGPFVQLLTLAESELLECLFERFNGSRPSLFAVFVVVVVVVAAAAAAAGCK